EQISLTKAGFPNETKKSFPPCLRASVVKAICSGPDPCFFPVIPLKSTAGAAPATHGLRTTGTYHPAQPAGKVLGRAALTHPCGGERARRGLAIAGRFYPDGEGGRSGQRKRGLLSHAP